MPVHVTNYNSESDLLMFKANVVPVESSTLFQLELTAIDLEKKMK